MDADKRHELKQNDLAEALRGLADFSDKRNVAWLAAILAIAVIYAGYKYFSWQARLDQAMIAQRLSAISLQDESMGDKSLNDLRELLSRAKDPGTKSLIRMKLAQGLELAGKSPDGAPKLAEAEAEYTAIVNMPGIADATKAPALYRLGLLSETKRDFSKAREYFAKLSEDPRYLGSPFVELAKARLDTLDTLATPIVFEPGYKPLPPVPAVDESQMKSVLVPDAPAPSTPAVEPTAAPQSEPAADEPEAPASDAPAAPAEEPTEEPVEPEQP